MINNFFYNLALFRDKYLTSYKEQLHTACFAGLPDLVPLSHRKPKSDGLLLGMGRFGRILQVRSTPNRRELGNMLVVAPPRAGKSILAVSQLLTWKGSVIVNDIKGELYNLTADFRRSIGKVFKVDLSQTSARYDPLQGRIATKDLQSAATDLLHKPKQGDNFVFTQRAITMLTQIFIAGKYEGYALLPFALRMIYLGLDGCARELQRITQKHNLFPNLATRFLDKSLDSVDFDDKFLQSCWGTLTGEIDNLLNEDIIYCFTGSDFTARDIMTSDRPITVYLQWPERDLLALSPLVSLVWGSLTGELITTYDSLNGVNCKLVLLLVDEGGRTAIPSLVDHATTIPGRGMSLWIAVQSRSQLDAIYGRIRANILFDNMETQIYHRPCDQITAEYVVRCLGFRSGFAISQSTHDGFISNGKSEREIPLMTAQEIKQMKDDEIIFFHRNLPPVKAHRMDWRRFDLLRQRAKLPPPPLPVSPSFESVLSQVAESRTDYPPALNTTLFEWRRGDSYHTYSGLTQKPF